MATTGHETEAVNVQGLKASLRKTLNQGIKNEGTCSTAAGTAAKAVTLGTTFILEDNATVIVTFVNGISVSGATLAVTHTNLAGQTTTEAAKPIYYRGTALGGGLVKAGSKVLLRYNGTQFDIIGDLALDSGFSLMEDDANGLDVWSAIGNATITEDNTNAIDNFNF